MKFLYLFIKKKKEKKKKSEASKSTPFGHGQRREPPPSKPTGSESPSIMRFLMELLFYFLALSAWSCFYNLNWYTFLLLLTKLSPNLIENPTELFKFIFTTFASYIYIYIILLLAVISCTSLTHPLAFQNLVSFLKLLLSFVVCLALCIYFVIWYNLKFVP